MNGRSAAGLAADPLLQLGRSSCVRTHLQQSATKERDIGHKLLGQHSQIAAHVEIGDAIGEGGRGGVLGTPAIWSSCRGTVLTAGSRSLNCRRGNLARSSGASGCSCRRFELFRWTRLVPLNPRGSCALGLLLGAWSLPPPAASPNSASGLEDYGSCGARYLRGGVGSVPSK